MPGRKKTASCLYVVGVGPGDPELLTVKAARVLSSVPVIFVPRKDSESQSYASSIIGALVNESEQRVVALTFPMTRDRKRLEAHWNKAGEAIWQRLEAGEDCALVNIGDPLLYGTAIHVIGALRRDHPAARIEVVPGVSSINAAAARAVVPLGTNDERIAIISGHCEEKTIAKTLESFDTVVFLKVHTVFDRLLDILDRLNLAERCVYVSRCGTADEEVVRDIKKLKGKKLDYMSLLIVRR